MYFYILIGLLGDQIESFFPGMTGTIACGPTWHQNLSLTIALGLAPTGQSWIIEPP